MKAIKSRELTESEEAMLRELKNGMQSASEVGQSLWPVTKAGATNRKPQSFARPAGRILNRLYALGLVSPYYLSNDPRKPWKTTYSGRQWLAAHGAK